MPDLLHVFIKRWMLILAMSSVATTIALLLSIFSPKKYLSVATALPVNSAIADKARMFNPNIQYLYSDFGSSDELYRIEGTATLDTLFIATSKELNLSDHYSINKTDESIYKAAMHLKKSTKINRSSYGELKVKVWDRDADMAAKLANVLMHKLQELHQHLQNQTSVSILEKLRQEYASKQNEFLQLADSLGKNRADTTLLNFASAKKDIMKARVSVLTEELQQYEKMIGEYQLAVSTNTPVLLIVENARPSLKPDEPRVLRTMLFTLFASLLFGYLVALFIEGRKPLR